MEMGVFVAFRFRDSILFGKSFLIMAREIVARLAQRFCRIAFYSAPCHVGRMTVGSPGAQFSPVVHGGQPLVLDRVNSSPSA